MLHNNSTAGEDIRAARERFNIAIAEQDVTMIRSLLAPTYHIVTGRSAQNHGADEEAARALRVAGAVSVPASASDFGKEFLSLVAAVKVVASLDEALEHIRRHGSRHSEAIVTGDAQAASRFLNEVDAAAVFVNASTQFTDGGEFGLGAEVGISTQKLHARGPMGLRELTTYKWIVEGTGQVRP